MWKICSQDYVQIVFLSDLTRRTLRMKYKLIFTLDLDKIDNYYYLLRSSTYSKIHDFQDLYLFTILISAMHGFCQLVPISLLVLAIIRFPSHFFIGTGNYPFPMVCYDSAPVKETHAREATNLHCTNLYIFSRTFRKHTRYKILGMILVDTPRG